MACLTLPRAQASTAAQPDRGVHHSYLPALDGLRAIAVAAVVAYHLALPWARGGYLGVDLFFVLSGFLITGLLVGEREGRGRIDLRRFYSRRARRLLPALFLVLTVTSICVGIRANGVGLAKFRGDVVAALGYVANWRFVFSHQGYFDQFNTPSPIRHMWSLAIEEQFYVLWPPVLVGLVWLGRGSRRVAVAGTAALAAASVAAMALLYHPGHDLSRAYYGTDARAFELLVGALLALAVSRRAEREPRIRRGVHLVGAAGLAGFLWLVVTVPDTAGWMYRGGFLLASLLAAAAIWSVSRARPGPVGRLLSLRPLRWVGRVSYGIYLWHWPVIVLLSRSATGLSGNRLRVVQVAVALGASAASFYLLERPVRLGRIPGRRVWVAVPAAVATALASVAWATVPVSAAGRPAPAPVAEAPVAQAPGPPAAPVPPPLGLLGVRTPSAQAPLRVLVVGDSVMWDASPGITSALEATGVVRVDQEAVLGFGLTNSAYNWRAAWPKLVAADQPDLVVAMFGGWDAKEVSALGADWYANLTDQAVAVLTAGNARVLWLEYPRNQPPDVAGRPPVDQAANERLREGVNAVFADSAGRHAGLVSYLPVDPVLDQQGRYTAFLAGPDGVLERVRKHDNIHFCPAGAERVGAWVLDAVSASYGLPSPNPAWSTALWRLDHRYDQPSGACA